MKEATIVIPARNAASTIERAIKSALMQGDYALLLVDDFSEDDTVERAVGVAGARLNVVRPHAHRTLGFARQTALDVVRTRFLIWLDADDELLPGRVNRLVDALEREKTDIAADGAEIFDGLSGRFQSVSSIPSFMRRAQPPVREFERNYLPGDGVVAFRTEKLKWLGYDPALHADIDVILRAVAAGYHFSLLEETGYRIYTYPASLSRCLGEQRGMYRAALMKHSYESVRKLYEKAGYGPRITAWGLTSMAVFRSDYENALRFIDEASGWIEDPNEVLESDGPTPYSEGWRRSFHRGTTLLLVGSIKEATRFLQQAELFQETAEVSNNLGVALALSGDHLQAKAFFERALFMRPGYLDAEINLNGSGSLRITPHPLRTLIARDDYQPQSLDPQLPSWYGISSGNMI